MSLHITPPLTRNERIGIGLMCLAAWAAVFLLAAWTEHQVRRSAKAWPPHVTQERTSK
jgi:hypothetical protein